MKTVELGYTLTPCHAKNANCGTLQKQIVLKIDGGICNIMLCGFTNKTEGDTYHTIAHLTEKQYQRILIASSNFNMIYWRNLPKLEVNKYFISNKKFELIKKIEGKYFDDLEKICEPLNKLAIKKATLEIKRILKPFFQRKEFLELEKYLFIQ